MHKEVNIYFPPEKHYIGIDEGISELIRELWRLGIYTVCCCQDEYFEGGPYRKDTIWLSFNYDMLIKFTKAIRNIEGIKRHILAHNCLDLDWDYRIVPHKPDWNSNELYSYQVAFPGKHYNRVVKYFKSL